MHKLNTHRLNGVILALLATIFWAGNYVVAPQLAKALGPAELAFWRWLICIVVLLPFFAKTLYQQAAQIKQHKGHIASTSFFGVALFIYCIYSAANSPNAIAIKLALLATTFPVITQIFRSILDKKWPAIEVVIGTTIVFLGIVMVVTNNNPTLLLQQSIDSSDVWMFCAACAFACFNILLDSNQSKHDISGNAFLMAMFICGLLWILPVYAYEIYQSKQKLDISSLDLHTLGLVYLGTCASALAFICWAKAGEYISLETKGYIYYTIPISSAVLDFIFKGQPANLWDGLNFALIIGGILVAMGKIKYFTAAKG